MCITLGLGVNHMDDINQLMSDLQELVTRLRAAVQASDKSRAGQVFSDPADTARTETDDAGEGFFNSSVRADESGQAVLSTAYRGAEHALVIKVDLTLEPDAYRGSVKLSENEPNVSSIRREQVYTIDSGRTGANDASQHHDTSEDLADRVSALAAELIMEEAWPLTYPWSVTDPGHAEAAAAAVERFKKFTHSLAIGRPVSEAATALGLPDGGDLVATLLPLPGDHAAEALTRWIRIAGVLAGVITGNHPLTIACMKSLVKSEATSFLADAFGDAAPRQHHQASPAEQQPDVSTNAFWAGVDGAPYRPPFVIAPQLTDEELKEAIEAARNPQGDRKWGLSRPAPQDRPQPPGPGDW
jgi:hypothetical protein